MKAGFILEFMEILKRFNIEIFEFVQTGEHEYTLRTEKPLPFECELEIKSKITPFYGIKFETLQTPFQTALPGVGPTPTNSVTHPAHYNSGKIEVIEFIEDQGFGRDFCLGNALKYISRAGKKDPTKEIEDLEKAVWYVNRVIEVLKAEKENRPIVRPNDMNPRVVEKGMAMVLCPHGCIKPAISATDASISKKPEAKADCASTVTRLWGEWVPWAQETPSGSQSTVAFVADPVSVTRQKVVVPMRTFCPILVENNEDV